ncbi:MAG TPA: ABC transporter substrate-binding protein [Chloroflexota bacterium]|nr:ABC transporter substrate-binding protein [Chloroflexota bacterium]
MSKQRAPLIPHGGLTRQQFLRLTGAGAAAIAAGAPLAAQAAHGRSGPADTPIRGGSIRLGHNADITTFKPWVVGDNVTIWVLTLFYDQLTRPTVDGRSVEPSLAKSWEISPDGKTYTFHLRPGVTFHDGSPLTAADVKFSIEQAAFAKDTQWNFLFGALKGLEVVDDRTVRAHLNAPHAPFLSDVALFSTSILPKRLYDQLGDKLWKHPIGTGPFKWGSHKVGTELILLRNDNFWRHNGQPYIDSFHQLNVPDANTRALQVQTGELDIAVYIAPASAKAMMGNPAVNVHIDPFMESHFISLNTSLSDPPFNNKLVRQALNYAVDKNAIVQKVLFGFGQPSGQALPPMFGYDPSLKPYPYNPAKAKALLKQAGFANGFSCKCLIDASILTDNQVATLVQQQLAQVGVTMSIQAIESATLNNMFFGSKPPFKYQMRTNSMSADIVDPDELIEYAIAGNGGAYAIFTMYNNATVNSLVTRGAATVDRTQRQKLYYQMDRIYHDEAPVIFLFSVDNISLSSSKVQGFHPLPTGNYRLEEVWLKP